MFVCPFLFSINRRIRTSKQFNKGSIGEGELLCKLVQRLVAPHDSPPSHH